MLTLATHQIGLEVVESNARQVTSFSQLFFIGHLHPSERGWPWRWRLRVCGPLVFFFFLLSRKGCVREPSVREPSFFFSTIFVMFWIHTTGSDPCNNCAAFFPHTHTAPATQRFLHLRLPYHLPYSRVSFYINNLWNIGERFGR